MHGNSPTPGGLHAVSLATGERAWFAPPPPLACGGARTRLQRRAVGRDHGDSRHRLYFDTVNHVKAHGGSINGPAPVVVGGRLYVNSGYGAFGSRTGNVLLAFAVER